MGPKISDKDYKVLLFDTYGEILHRVRESDYTTMSLPLMSAGIFGISEEESMM